MTTNWNQALAALSATFRLEVGERVLLLLFCTASMSVLADTPQKRARTPLEAAQRFLKASAESKLVSAEGRLVNFAVNVDSLGLTGAEVDGVYEGASTTAVARIRIQDAKWGEQNGYLLASRGPTGDWGVMQLRGLNLTLEVLEAASWKSGKGGNPIHARQAQARAELAAQSDRALSRWFDQHEGQLRRFEAAAKTVTNATFVYASDRAPPASDLRFVLYELPAVTAVKVANGRVTVTILDAAGETTGFMYSPDERPSVSPAGLTWVEGVGRDWYFFRDLQKCQVPRDRWNCMQRH